MDKIKRSGTPSSSYTKNLKSLYIQVPVFATSYMRYITSCAPDQLEDLEISMTEINFFDWIRISGMETVLKLANRISSLKAGQIYIRVRRKGGEAATATSINSINSI